ncbi:hypothetical protein [Anatilimnocola floriformis]|uniref:hypothetical protein n=1 Tax=Anatilimnocola floriformis TaxID=2948575 RepID=UPI0020C538C8|nr:hypothetical protein [Anatilimnocola floriformis]
MAATFATFSLGRLWMLVQSVTEMPHAEMTQHVRLLVAEAFARAGMPQPSEFSESILIKGGNYCGRRFTGEGGHAIWFVEENQLKFYDADGKLTHVVSTLLPVASFRRAA